MNNSVCIMIPTFWHATCLMGYQRVSITCDLVAIHIYKYIRIYVCCCSITHVKLNSRKSRRVLERFYGPPIVGCKRNRKSDESIFHSLFLIDCTYKIMSHVSDVKLEGNSTYQETKKKRMRLNSVSSDSDQSEDYVKGLCLFLLYDQWLLE